MKIFQILLILSFLINAGASDPLVSKNVDKTIKKTFEIENYSAEKVGVTKTVNNKTKANFNGSNFLKLKKNNQVFGYAYIDKAPSKTAEFDYLILLNSNFEIAETKVLVYREEYGGEIGSRRWLSQFTGISKSNEVNEISAISGATISVRSMKMAVQNFLESLETLRSENIL